MAADLKGEIAEDSDFGSHHRRRAQRLSLGDAAAPFGRPAKRMEKLTEDARAPAEVREFMDTDRRFNVLRRTDLSLAFVSSGI